MTEPSVSFAGNLTDDPELRHTAGGDLLWTSPGGDPQGDRRMP